jgi:ABC-2 type transport system ATP-binding protein
VDEPAAATPGPVMTVAASLTATALSAGYRGRPVLHDIDLAFGAGLHLIIGPNGAGKTTLFRVLAGVLRPTSGEVRICGRDPGVEVSVKRKVGVGAHRAALASRLSVADNLYYWARVLAMPAAEQRASVARVTDLLDLDEVASQRASSLSRGQAQRVSLARALLSDPPVLLLDEPFSGVDPAVTAQLRGYLRTLADEGRTLLVSTHELAEANAIGDDVTVLREGRIVGQGDAGKLRSALVGDGYRLRIKGSGDLPVALGRLGYQVEASQHDGVIVSVADEGAASKLLAGLVDAGVSVSEATPAANPLEDLYLHLQGKGGASDNVR